MADYTRQIKSILSDFGCYFIKHGKGDHETWYSPILKRPFTVDGSITKRTSALFIALATIWYEDSLVYFTAQSSMM